MSKNLIHGEVRTDNSIRTYLEEIARIPLLTQEQEVSYGTQVQQMMSLLSARNTLTMKLHRSPSFREWAEQVQLPSAELNETLACGQTAKRKMIEANLRLVVAIAKKYQNRGMEFLDLIQEGTIGLQRGVEKFDPNKGFRLSSYAYHWIRQGVTSALATDSRMIRLPIYVTSRLNQIKKAQLRLSQKLGHTPTVSQVAAELGLTPMHVLSCLEWAQPLVSLQQRFGDDTDELGDLLEGSSPTPLEILIEMESSPSKELESLMEGLTPKEREVLALRFGLMDGKALTLAQIAKRLNVSHQCIQLLETKALDKMRSGVKEKEAAVTTHHDHSEPLAVVDCLTAPQEQLISDDADIFEGIDPNASSDASSDGTLDRVVNFKQIGSCHQTELDALQLQKIQDDLSVEKAVNHKLVYLRRSSKPALIAEKEPAPTAESQPKRVFHPSEFAELVGVSVRTLQRWDIEGVLIAYRNPKGRRFYTGEQYSQYLESSKRRQRLSQID